MRDIDMDMFFDEGKKQYYCMRCCFTGDEAAVKALNEQAKYRYKAMKLRVTDFGADNVPISWKPHKRGAQ